MKIHNIAANWDRIKVSLRAGLCLHSEAEAAKHRTSEIQGDL